MRNKFSTFEDFFLKETISSLTETKINNYFPNSQFFAKGHKMFRKDRNKNVGGLILHVNGCIPSKLTLFTPMFHFYTP